MKLTSLRVMGRNFGSNVLQALRMAFKSYEPAVALTQVNLKGPIFRDDAAEMERLARSIMDSGEVDRAEDLFILCEVLQFTHDVLKKVLSRETEVKCYLPIQKVADFAPDGPVMRELRKVIEEVVKMEEEYQAENEVLAAEFDADSFQMDDGTLTDEETHTPAKEVQVEPAASQESWENQLRRGQDRWESRLRKDQDQVLKIMRMPTRNLVRCSWRRD